jgi:DNA-directed RNA polymerase subunit K/omega
MEDAIPITKYEKVRLLGQRASQLAGGALPTVDVTGMTDLLKIAAKEYKSGTIPLCVIRHMPNGQIIQISINKVKSQVV